MRWHETKDGDARKIRQARRLHFSEINIFYFVVKIINFFYKKINFYYVFINLLCIIDSVKRKGPYYGISSNHKLSNM